MICRGKAASTGKSILGKSESKDKKLDRSSPLVQPPKCPECASQKVWKDGLRYKKHGDVQRYLCRSCSYRFSEAKVKLNIFGEPSETPRSRPKMLKTDVHDGDFSREKLSYELPFVVREDVGSHGVASVGKSINNLCRYSSYRQVCVSEREAKNLSQQQKTRQKQAAGATKPDKATIKGKLVEFAWWLKKQGYADLTVRNYTRNIRFLTEKGANVLDVENVKENMANQKWSEATRHVAINAYTVFLRMLGKTWNPPICKVTRKLPFIPTEKEIDALIAGCGKKTATFLQLLKETAMRSGEANNLEWTDVDFQRRLITLNKPEKNGNPRIFKVSSKLIDMLATLPKKNLRTFGGGPTGNRKSPFFISRKHIARKLQNPRLLRISFHTLRHWKATMLYHETKDPLYVKEFLGHKKLDTTLLYIQLARTLLLYIQLARTLFNETTDVFNVKVASKPEEINQLLGVGFEYVCEKDGLLYFRKRK